MTLTDFLLLRIAEDEAAVAKVRVPVRDGSALSVMSLMLGGHDDPGSHEGPGVAVVISPDRVLAECEAKRRIVEMAAYADRFPVGPTNETDTGAQVMLETVVRALALPYANHPDYRQEWQA